VLIAGDRGAALDLLRLHEPAVATLDLGLPPDPDGTSEGFATLIDLLTLRPDLKVIVASGHGARDSALRAIDLGAYDFYQKPVVIEELGLIVRRAFHLGAIEAENRKLRERAPPAPLEGLITAAPEMLKVVRMVEKVADTSVSVMLLGASGTGKEVIARGLHARSRRRDGPFVAINCSAIPHNLLEAELFGHEKGAFTGAVKTTEGKIELANGGTLFLDEIGDVPLDVQVKLLRFLQERKIERLGGRRELEIDCRVVTATHRDIDAMVKAGSFRDDLYFRLAGIVVRIPPLSERVGDAALLARHFVHRFSAEHRRPIKPLSADAIAAIADWPWTGNVRELANAVERAVIMADGRRITAEDLDLSRSSGEEALSLKAAREAADRRAIRVALARSDGNVTTAARLLGISRPTFYDLARQYGMEASER
jgi:two-component system NtrC family response regulator